MKVCPICGADWSVYGVEWLKSKRNSYDYKCKKCKSKRKPVTKTEGRPYLMFSDVHAPYHQKDAVPWLKHVHEKYDCHPHVYCGGDLFDWHRGSRHVSETDALSAQEELEIARAFSAELSEAFPVGTLVLGNHDRIPARQIKELGLPDGVLRDYNDLYNLPSTWNIEKLYAVIKDKGLDFLIEHGDGSTGVNGCINTAIVKGSSFGQGHIHSFPSVQYRANHFNVIFGANAGCMCDNTSLAMRYGTYAKHKPVVGCLLVYPATDMVGAHAVFLPMNLG
jgi:hypothetical protein